MFYQVGKELKRWAKFLVVLMTLPSILLAVYLLNRFNNMGLPLVISLIICILLVGIVYFLARLACIKLYAYGELVDRVASVDQNLKILLEKTDGEKIAVANEDIT